MGFIYSKPLSIEEVYSKFDTNGDGKISRKEAKAAKNMDIFTNFKINKGMDLQTFESENRDVYSIYEQGVTTAYKKQVEKVQSEMLNLTENEMAYLNGAEKELAQEKQEIEDKLMLRNEAKKAGIPFSSEELKNLSIRDLLHLFEARKIMRATKEMLDRDVRNTPMPW